MKQTIISLIFVSSFLCVTSSAFASGIFRTNLISISPKYNEVIPLSTIDFAGWGQFADMIIGSYDSKWVIAYSLSKKNPVWWLKSESELVTPVLVHQGWIILGFRNGKLLKVDAKTGEKAWEVALDTFVATKPDIVGTTLVAYTAAQQVHALNMQDGSRLWSYDVGFPPSITMQGSASIEIDTKANKVFVPSSTGSIIALDLNSGNLIWRHETSEGAGRFRDIVGEVALSSTADKYSVANANGLVMTIDATSSIKSIVWQDEISAISTTTFANGTLFVGCVNGDIHAYDQNTGKKRWRVNTGPSTISKLYASEKALYAQSLRGRISVLSRNDGKMLWNDDLGAMLNSQPIVHGDTIYFATGLRNLYGYKFN